MSANQIAFLVPIDNRWGVAENLLSSLRDTTRQVTSPRFVILAKKTERDAWLRICRLSTGFELALIDEDRGLPESLNREILRLPSQQVAIITGDLVLAPGWLDPMIAVFRRNPSSFAVGSVHLSACGQAIEHAGVVFDADGCPINFQPETSFLRHKPWREFPALSTACCVLQRDRFLVLGGFDGSIDAGNQGIDLCLRARMHGWPSFVANQSRVRRLCPASTEGESPDAPPAQFFNRWQIITRRLHLDWAERIASERLLHGTKRRWGLPSFAKPLLPQSRRSEGPEDARPNGPIRVLVDFGRLSPGGANGGIKIFVIEMLAAIRQLAPDEFVFLWLIPSPLGNEAKEFAGPLDEIWLLASNDTAPDEDQRVYRLTATDSQLARSLNADLLYAPFGVTDFQSADIPTIGVAVDVLHRDYPDTLPQPEVAARETWFDRMAHTYFRVQCISQWTENQVRKYFPASGGSTFVTHCAVHSRIQPLGSRAATGENVFLYPANAWVHKNHDTLLVGYRQYLRSASGNRWKLVLSGHRDAEMDRVLAHAKALGLDGHFEFVGYLDFAAFSILWARTGALVFPSQHEGFGIPVLEAMRLGVPVIADRVGSIPEVAGDACLYADMRNPSKIATALHRMYDDAALRESLSGRGRRRAADFSLDAEAAKLLATFREAVATFKKNGITWRWTRQ